MTVLRLREDVLITPYDGRDESQRFVAGVDGRHFVISAGLAVLLDEMRVPATLESLAQRASDRTGVCITAEELELLLRERVPSVLLDADSDPQPLAGPVRFRIRLWNAETLAPLLRGTRRLFSWRVAIAFIAALLCVEALVAAEAPSVVPQGFTARDAALGVVLTLAGMALHEFGHLAACHRFGARHGGIGLGLYWCFPVAYAEVQGAWMLPRKQRAVVNAAGAYAQCVFLVAIGALYLCFEARALLFAMSWTHLLLLHTLNPAFRFDGYWLLAHLGGVHNLHRRIREVACNACSGRAWPSRTDVALLMGFIAGTSAYFAFLLNALAHGVAGTLSAISIAWDGNMATVALRSIVLLICAAAIVLISLLLARALRSIFTETANDR